jgi:hypothetical protein
MPNGTRMNAPHMVIGLWVMALGVALILDRFGVIPAEDLLQYWPVGLVLLGASMVLQALTGQRAGVAGGPRQDIPIGAAIWLVILGLFLTHTFERRSTAAREDGENIRLFALLSGDRRNPVTNRFRGAELTAVLGGTRLDLTQAQVAPGDEAVVDVFALMGGAILTIPKHWVVDIQATSIMGGINDSRNDEPRRGRRGRSAGDGEVLPQLPGPAEPVPLPPPKPDPPPVEDVERPDNDPSGPPPRIVVRGFVMMGGLNIQSPEATGDARDKS